MCECCDTSSCNGSCCDGECCCADDVPCPEAPGRGPAPRILSYALRGCSRALLAGSNLALASCSRVDADGDRWLLMAVRGHLGGMRQ